MGDAQYTVRKYVIGVLVPNAISLTMEVTRLFVTTDKGVLLQPVVLGYMSSSHISSTLLPAVFTVPEANLYIYRPSKKYNTNINHVQLQECMWILSSSGCISTF